MTEKLKTLKEIARTERECCSNCIDEGIENICPICLRNEAKKWIKHINDDIKTLQDLESKPQAPLQKMATKGLDEVLEGQIKWIKLFFNIDEK